MLVALAQRPVVGTPLHGSVGGVWQLPLAQLCPPLHCRPHAPQLFWSLCVSTQPPPQFVSPARHAHVPPLQRWSPLQAMSQPPQCWLSLAGFTQPPPHAIDGSVQLSTHEPIEQSCPAAQRDPQAPQCSPLLAVLTQRPPHSCSGGAQRTAASLAESAGLPTGSSQLQRTAMRTHHKALRKIVMLEPLSEANRTGNRKRNRINDARARGRCPGSARASGPPKRERCGDGERACSR